MADPMFGRGGFRGAGSAGVALLAAVATGSVAAVFGPAGVVGSGGAARMDNRPEPVRTPDEVRARGNRLADERSLYLRQHARNPVEWYPWGDEAFTRARDEDKPVFLSIGYSSCHWCHVMEGEVFEDDEVARFLNAHFVSIKVDREERPDVDSVYMEAVQQMTGSGGWPLSTFLVPDGRPFFGGTYFPRPQFLALLRRVHELWGGQRGDLLRQAEALTEAVRAEPILSARPPDAAALASTLADIVAAGASTAWAAYDPRWGGVRARMKFPTPLRWHFLLHHWRKTGDAQAAEMVVGTLRAMASGGIHDHVGGGFHRYTVDDTWLVPHFEKMLYDNALLARLYVEAAVAFDDRDGLRSSGPSSSGPSSSSLLSFGEVARDTLDFLLREMRDPRGGFYGSFDADSGGEEGSFYVWTPEELAAVAGNDAAALAMLLGVTPGGNFEGKSIPTRRVAPSAVAAAYGLDEAQAAGLFEKYREALRAHRAGRVPPGLDRKVVTSWNGLAVAAFALAYRVFGDERYRDGAERAADFLWETHRRGDGSLFRASNDGVATGEGILDDYAFLADGLLELYQATGDERHLRRALSLLAFVREQFRHPEAGWYQVRSGHDTPLGRKVEVFDHARPSGQAVLLHALLAAAALTGSEAWRAEVEETLGARSQILGRAGLEMAWWLDAAEKLNGPFYEVVVAGGADDERTKALAAVVRSLAPSHAVFVQVPADGPTPGQAELLPPARGKTAQGGIPTAFVCRFGSCKRPTSDPATLRSQILEGWHR